MLDDSEVVRRTLLNELRTIRRRGFIFLHGTSSFAALTELASALSTPASDLRDDDRRDLAEALLRHILRRVAKDEQEHTGIEELLGLKEGSSRNIGVRLDDAAPYLGYTDGESLRQTQIVSKRSSRKQKVIDVLLNRIVSALIATAFEAGLVRPPLPPPPPPIPPAPPVPTRPKPFHLTLSSKTSLPEEYLGPLGHANGMLASELRTVFTDGIKTALAHGKLPLLTEMADDAYGMHASTRERVEALLTWAIGSTEIPGWQDKSTLFALTGLDAKRQLKHEARLRRAFKHRYPTRKYDAKEFSPLREAHIAVELSEPLWELAAELGLPCGPCLGEMHTNGALVPAPDPAVHRCLSNWLSVSLGYVEFVGRDVIFHPPPIAD